MGTFEPTPEQIAAQRLYAEMGLSDEEYQRITERIGRQPNYTEVGLYSVMWSEHCSYKHSKKQLRKFPTKAAQVLQGPGEGAGIVDIGDQQAVVFKIESHNHPSAVEPYEASATGVGGILRDVFSMGARPIASLNSLRFGELDTPRVKELFSEVIRGIAAYGNHVGVPTVGGEVYFDESYEGNPLVNAMVVGLLNHDQIKRGVLEGVGNPVIYLGATTGRDGIHGATFASGELSEEDEKQSSSVAIGDAEMGRRVMEATLELIQRGVVLGVQDMGAAGLTSSSAEMAAKSGLGVELNLDHVPQREVNMSPYEMMLSESQERMLLVVAKENLVTVQEIAEKWGVHAPVIGTVIQEQQYRLFYQGELVADLPVASLTDEAPVYEPPVEEPAYLKELQQEDPAPFAEPESYAEALLQLLQQPSVASKEWAYQQFDCEAQGNTVVAPGSDAAVVRIGDSKKAIAITTDGNGRYVYLDPEVGGKIVIAEAARNLVASGAQPLGATDGLNYGSPEKPEIYWQFQHSIDGMAEACNTLAVPIISGNVSLYNEANGKAIYPTPIIGMVGLIPDLDQVVTQGWKTEGDLVYLVGATLPEVGGSEYQKLRLGRITGRPPYIDLQVEQATQQAILTAIRKGLVQSAHDLAEGGIAVALAEACISGEQGVEVALASDLRPDLFLFSESQSRFLLSINPADREAFEGLLAEAKLPFAQIGQVRGDGAFILKYGDHALIETDVEKLSAAWKGAIPCLMN